MVDVAVLGHILNEKIIFPDREIYPVLGSPVAYSSACMAKLDLDVGIVTKIGPDFPRDLLSVFEKTGVDVKGLKTCENSTNNELTYGKDGQKTLKFLTKADDIDFRDIPQKYKEVKLFLISPMDYEISLETIKKIFKLGRIMAIDIGGYGGGTSDSHPEIKDGRDIKKLCPFFDIVKGSIEDYRHIFGESTDETYISQKIIEWGAEVSAITLGEKGSYVKKGPEEQYIHPYPVKEYIDQTGAGDCYFAGFLYEYLNSRDPFKAAVFGTVTTSYVIERSGGVSEERLPNNSEIMKRIENYKK